MKVVKSIVNFYIFSNLHVSLAVFCLTKLTLLKLGQQDDLLPAMVFMATVVSYNFIRFVRIDDVHGFMLTFIQKNKGLLMVLTGGCTLILGYLLLQLPRLTLMWLIPFAICTLFYVYPTKQHKISQFSLRSIGCLKIFLIAFSWAGVTVLLVPVHEGLAFDLHVWTLFLQRFLFILVITLPFDIRDLAIDHNHIKTLPEVFGIEKTRKFGLVCLMLFLALDFISPDAMTFRIDFFIAVLSLLFLVRASTEQDKYYSAFWIDGLPILWYLMALYWLS
ncbi:hypothetical protein MWU59_05825 [Flavobacteriaceae bacterium F08102]|nr:hypothetical protein [Flavobacteriaceae bacterium F08102]